MRNTVRALRSCKYYANYPVEMPGRNQKYTDQRWTHESSVALVVDESCKNLKKLQESCKAILQVNAYRYKDPCKILASLSIHLQNSCKPFDSSCKITCKMNRKACKLNRKACKNLASFSIQMLGRGGGQRRKGADFCSSTLVLAFAWAFLASLKTRASALLTSMRSAPDLALATKE